MCRLLYIKGKKEFPIYDYLKNFSVICKNSREYQGHGWGLAYLNQKSNFQEFEYYKCINPIWAENFEKFKNYKTKTLMAHARSAFEDKDIRIENNMPFYDENYVFIFNGELRGVKIKEQGRIGAEKIFNYIKRFDKKKENAQSNRNIKEAMEKAISIIKKRTDLIKALNIIIADKERAYVNNYYTMDEDYFCLRKKIENKNNEDERFIICSQEFENENKAHWEKLELGLFVF